MLYTGGCREIAFGLEKGSVVSLDKVTKGLKLRTAFSADQVRIEIGKRIQMCTTTGIKPGTELTPSPPGNLQEQFCLRKRLTLGQTLK
jgi:hypothetical protein